MKTLNKTHNSEHTRLVGDLASAKNTIDNALAEYNAAVSAAFAKLAPTIEKFNEVLDACRSFRDTVTEDMDAYENERSEKWAESDAASSFQEWKSSWEDIDLDDIEVSEPDEMEIESYDDRASDFEMLPTERS